MLAVDIEMGNLWNKSGFFVLLGYTVIGILFENLTPEEITCALKTFKAIVLLNGVKGTFWTTFITAVESGLNVMLLGLTLMLRDEFKLIFSVLFPLLIIMYSQEKSFSKRK